MLKAVVSAIKNLGIYAVGVGGTLKKADYLVNATEDLNWNIKEAFQNRCLENIDSNFLGHELSFEVLFTDNA